MVPAEKRQELLGQGWQQSGDRLWTTQGDATGFHVLVAEAKTGYSWRTVATLGTNSLETDKWIGNACVTGDGSKAVVVYAPRTFTNKDQLFARGGLTAVVDLVSGEVKRLPVRTTLAYFNPGCGAGDTVALTQAGEEDRGKTRLLTVDSKSAKLSQPTDLDGQLTSAVPFQEGFAVASSGGVLKVGRDGQKKRLSTTKGTPSYLRPDAEGGVVYLAPEDTAKVHVQRATSGVGAKVTTLASGKAGELGVAQGAAGKVFITGKAAEVKALPQFVRKLDIGATAEVSTNGEAAITEQLPTGSAMQADPQAWHLKTKSLRTGKEVGFTVNATAALKPREVEPGYTCAIPRNDTNIQVYQPKPKQVEWAADMAVKNHLDMTRPPGWRNLNTPGNYTPQGLFPQLPMVNTGGNGKVPAQILLGIMGQESNLWQAARHALPGELGNPLIGNYYGLPIYDDVGYNDWDVNFADADCGYGVTQMTDGMRKSDTSLTYQKKFAIATDYAANVAAGLQKIQEKWNQVQNAGMKVHDNDYSNIENWFLAVWAYNSGFNAQGQKDPTAWGVGWSNNPANPKYDRGRGSFGENPRDFATPQKWPYPEKVMGFAANPPSGFEDENTEVPFFRAASWNGVSGDADTPGTDKYNRRHVKPEWWTFCNASNNCVKDGQYTPNKPDNPNTPEDESTIGEPTGPCAHQDSAGYYDLRCWWHSSVSWKSDNCSSTCGFEFVRYDYPEYASESSVPDGTSYPPTCDLGDLAIQGSSLIVDHNAPGLRNKFCPQPTSSGSMTFRTDDRPAAMADLHQIGSGMGAHMWQTTVKGDNVTDRKAEITAQWTLNRPLNGKADVWAFIPAHGKNKATQAQYQVFTKDGVVKTGVVDQSRYSNQWALVGSYVFDQSPIVRLSSVTPNGGVFNNEVMVFDAIAFTSPKPKGANEKATPIINNATGKCLVPEDAGGASSVHQRDCTGTFTDHWLISIVPNGSVQRPDLDPIDWWTYRFVHRGTGLCLASHTGIEQNNDFLETKPCSELATVMYGATDHLASRPVDNGFLLSAPSWGVRPAGNSHDDHAFIQQQKVNINDTSNGYLLWDY
ncbi:hypothetical protein [Lentzea aerocolonigenes]|uniref:golvesin C-terminal-like domain-containing protein n=1 Tax=Lentzea aerocolonigenes TaxID=68170 RepID=UPI0012E28E82|nr:hypothetical protein [Lentzea aerocolonigenes]